MKKEIIIIAALLISVMSFAQTTESGCNKYDQNGKKTGLWITQHGVWKFFTEYKNGKEDGVSYMLNTSNDTLESLAQYSNGECVVFYRFDMGGLRYRLYDFKKLEIKLKPPYKGYTWDKDKGPDRICKYVSYYSNGNKKEEGEMIFWSWESFEIDSIDYGEIKYYNEDGTLKEIK